MAVLHGETGDDMMLVYTLRDEIETLLHEEDSSSGAEAPMRVVWDSIDSNAHCLSSYRR